MNSLRTLASHWFSAGTEAVRVEVINTRGSTPQAVGARMLVSLHDTAGTIGGGHLEWQATATARELVTQLDTAGLPLQKSYALGPSLGQCCGGAITLRFERINSEMLNRWPDEPALFALSLFGMGHVAQSVVRTLLPLCCRIDGYDARPEQVQAAMALFAGPGHAAEVFWHLDDGLERCDSGADERSVPDDPTLDRSHCPRLALVMTHRHDLDFELCRRLLRDPRWDFVGLIGSLTKRTRFLRRLEQMGVPASDRARLSCPIGMAEIRHKQPEVLAISIAAQLLQVSRTAPPLPTPMSLEYADV